jgi:uncharacterized protein YbdZ (MbtH family)
VSDYAVLGDLPRGHELRQRPLEGCECRNHLSKQWIAITPSWAIAKHCFDDLTENWTDFTLFRAKTCE